MKRMALAAIAAALIAGCGGGDDNSDEPAASATPADTETQAPPKEGDAPSKLTGKRNEANVQKALGLVKDGDVYSFSGGPCKVSGFAIDKAGVEQLLDEAEEPRNVIKNDSGTAAVELTDLSYYCAIQGANRMKNIP